MSQLRIVFLDYGGTLGFGNESPAELWQTFLRELAGLEVALPETQQAWGKADAHFRSQSTAYHGPSDEFWLDYNRFILQELGIDSGEQQRLAHSIQAAFQQHKWSSSLFPETREALHELRRQNYRIGVISNNTDRFPQELAEQQLADFFESITYSGELGLEKPDPAIFHLAMQRMGSGGNDAVHVGDSYEKDVVGARAAGITPILIDREGRYPEADCLRITDLRDLPSVLQNPIP